MEKLVSVKNTAVAAIYMCLGWTLTLMGGWDKSLGVLITLMGVDFITGMIVAGWFHASPKSPGGGLESRAGRKGLIRKFTVLLIVLACHQMDRLMGVDYIRDTVIIGFCANEVVSILENARLMDLPISGFLKKTVDRLLDQAEAEGGKNDV